jgi:hypothetical protein
LEHHNVTMVQWRHAGHALAVQACILLTVAVLFLPAKVSMRAPAGHLQQFQLLLSCNELFLGSAWGRHKLMQ